MSKRKEPINLHTVYTGVPTAITADAITNIYTRQYLHMCTSMFKWDNLPIEIPERFLELQLIYHGRALFARTEMGKFIVCDFNHASDFDMYWEPVSVRGIAPRGDIGEFNEGEFAIVWNNELKLPTIPTIVYYADWLTELNLISRVNIKAQKTPVLLKGRKQDVLTLKNLYMQYDGNQPFLYGSSDMDFENALTVLKTDAPFHAPAMFSLMKQVFNMGCSALGINNVDTEKKEREVTAEATGNDQQVELIRQGLLRTRREACEKINLMFNLNVKCDFRLNMPLPNNSGGFASGLDDESIKQRIDINPDKNTILTGGAEPSV